jgi:chemotaxis protein CheD
MTGALTVGMGEIKTLQCPGSFICLGLGSCIGLVAYDAKAQVAGMIHVMLPHKFPDRPVDQVGKFADTGIPELFRQLEEMGAVRRRLVVAMAGGAQVFKFGSGADSRMDIGRRNAESVTVELTKLGVRPLAQDVGGSKGRTMTISLPDGLVTVKTLTEGTVELCRLAEPLAKAG